LIHLRFPFIEALALRDGGRSRHAEESFRLAVNAGYLVEIGFTNFRHFRLEHGLDLANPRIVAVSRRMKGSDLVGIVDPGGRLEARRTECLWG
jgi:hypothetical protein